MTDDPTREPAAPEAADGGSQATTTPVEPGEGSPANARQTSEAASAEDVGARASEPEEPRFERRWSKRAGASQPPPEVAQPVASADLQAQLEKEKTRADELHDRLQRSMADLSNYRKRSESEREEMTKFANMVLVSELLPVLDNFERALSAIPHELEQFTWLQGIALIERHLRALLEREGLQTIEAAGTPFNPSLHEAIVEEESADVAPGTVIAEMQRGYMMHGRVIRPTLAKVSKAVEGGKTESESDSIVPDDTSPAEATEQDGKPSDGS
jgi:molecular chaperone GrpE